MSKYKSPNSPRLIKSAMAIDDADAARIKAIQKALKAVYIASNDLSAMMATKDGSGLALPLPAWAYRVDELGNESPNGTVLEGREARALLARAVCTLEYEPEDADAAPVTPLAGNEVLAYPGVIMASAETLAQVEVVNNAKQSLVAALRAAASIKIRDEQYQGKDAESLARYAARKAGYVRFNLRHTYRQLHVLDDHCARVSFVYGRRRAIEAIGLDEAKRRLDRLAEYQGDRDDAGLKKAYAQLDVLRRWYRERGQEAQARLSVLHAKDKRQRQLLANISWLVPGQTETVIERAQLPAVMPYFLRSGAGLPEIRAPRAAEARAPRLDRKINGKPYLTPIQAYVTDPAFSQEPEA